MIVSLDAIGDDKLSHIYVFSKDEVEVALRLYAHQRGFHIFEDTKQQACIVIKDSNLEESAEIESLELTMIEHLDSRPVIATEKI